MNFLNPCPHVDWTVVILDSTASTNDVCREMGPWEAVQALQQSAGRGRRGRKFACGPGGLWISANVPASGLDVRGAALHVGVALKYELRPFASLRLRWPNDLLLHGKKVAGLLLESFGNGCLTIGLGLNVCNQPWIEMPELAATATNLASVGIPPSLEMLQASALQAFSTAHQRMVESGLAGGVVDWNRAADLPEPVRLILRTGSPLEGELEGLDEVGNLRVRDAEGRLQIVPHEHVERLKPPINVLDKAPSKN